MFQRADLHGPSASRLTPLLGLTILLIASGARAEVLDGALGNWLQQTAAPQLVKVLGTHPRFKGEKLTVVTMRDGSPTTGSNQLNRALEDAVTHRLLEQGQIRVTWRQQQQHCGIPEVVPYLLGIEITSRSRGRAQVNIALVDVQENIWVPGVHLRWSGTLTKSEQRALGKTLSRSATGSVDRPIAVSHTASLSEQLYAQIKCALPKGVSGTVHIDTQSEDALDPVAEALRQRLQRSALFPLTNRTSDAEWLLRLRPAEATGSNARLDVVLESAQGSNRQQLASIYVRNLALEPTALASSEPERVPAVESSLGATALLSGISHSQTSSCQHQQDKVCASIELDILQPAYLLIFRTQNGKVSGPQCKADVRRSDAVRKRYRLPLNADLDTGFYVVATADRNVARTLHKQLRRAPGHCGVKSGPLKQWLVQLQKLIATHDRDIEWRAVHLRDDAELKVADR
ncbi:MAG: hypothetical protein ACR2PZ_09090 [Pseudomonadales bacterium]